MARAAAEAYAARLRLRAAVPDIVALRAHAEGLRAGELRRAAGRLRDLSPEERAAVEQVTRAIVQKLLHRPTRALRATAAFDGPAGRRARASLMAALVAPPAAPQPDRPAATGQEPHHLAPSPTQTRGTNAAGSPRSTLPSPLEGEGPGVRGRPHKER